MKENTTPSISSFVVRWALLVLVFLLVNFGGTGRSAMRMIAILLGLFRVRERTFPIVKYTGHAFLSPEEFVK